MALITLWIGFLEWGSRRLLSNFAARKLCHAGCGMGFMLLDAAKPECRSFVWAVAASSVALTWDLLPLPPFRFASPRDVGVTVYLALISAWFYLQQALATLSFTLTLTLTLTLALAAPTLALTLALAPTLPLTLARFYLQLPATILAPLFFADPAGAVVGKWASRTLPANPRVYGQKTACGSLAVLLATFATTTYPCSLAPEP